MRSALTIEEHHIEIDAERIVVITLDGLLLSATPNTTHGLFSFVGNPLTTLPLSTITLRYSHNTQRHFNRLRRLVFETRRLS